MKVKPQPRITIVTPSYNQGRFLEETIRSVLNQGYENLEYIVIDGGSSDNSIDIIKKHETGIAIWVSETDRGQSDAINKGLQKASGEIVAWLNSDDTLEPGALSTVADYFTRNLDWNVLTGGCFCIDDQNRYIQLPGKEILIGTRPLGSIRACPYAKGSLALTVWFRDWFPQSSTFWRGGLMQKVGWLDERYFYSMDYDLWRRMAKLTEIHVVPEVLSNYRYHTDAKCMKDAWGALLEVLSINLETMGEDDFKVFSREAIRFLIDQLRSRQERVSGLEAQIAQILNSHSYRLGKAVLHPWPNKKRSGVE